MADMVQHLNALAPGLGVRQGTFAKQHITACPSCCSLLRYQIEFRGSYPPAGSAAPEQNTRPTQRMITADDRDRSRSRRRVRNRAAPSRRRSSSRRPGDQDQHRSRHRLRSRSRSSSKRRGDKHPPRSPRRSPCSLPADKAKGRSQSQDEVCDAIDEPAVFDLHRNSELPFKCLAQNCKHRKGFKEEGSFWNHLSSSPVCLAHTGVNTQYLVRTWNETDWWNRGLARRLGYNEWM